MTCIVGLEHDGKVYLGGDSAAVGEEGQQACAITDSKVFVIDDMIFGFCGSFRAGQLIKYGLKIPQKSAGKSDMEFLVIDFVDAIRVLFHEKGCLKKENEEETSPASFLIGYAGHLYYLDDDLHIGRVKEGYHSVGVGSDISLGSLFSTEDLIKDPKERLTIALQAAVKWSGNVRPPFNIICLEAQKPKTKSRNLR